MYLERLAASRLKRGLDAVAWAWIVAAPLIVWIAR